MINQPCQSFECLRLIFHIASPDKQVMGSTLKKALPANSSLTEHVLALQGGDLSVAEEIVKLVQTPILKFAYRLSGDLHVAEDLAQEAIFKGIHNILSLKEPEKFQSWVFQILKNEFLQRCRSAYERKTELSDTEQGTEESSTETNASVRQALNQLDPELRFVLILIDLEERSYDEAAEICVCTEATVRSRLSRARKKFKEVYHGE